MLSGPLCGAIRDVLTGTDHDPSWSRRAGERLDLLRQEHGFLAPSGSTLEPEPLGYRLWTFAGGRANNLLAKVLEKELGGKVTTGNLAIRLRERAGEGEASIRAALRTLAAAERPTDDEVAAYANTTAKARLSKFEPCLPERLLARHVSDATMDAAGARTAMAAPVVASAGQERPTPDHARQG